MLTADSTILVDCDGVLADLTLAVLRLYERCTGKLAPTEAVFTQLDMGKCLNWPACDEAITDAIEYESFCLGLPMYAQATWFLTHLENHFGKDNVLICTSPWNPSWAGQRAAWLQHRLGVSLRRQIQCRAKELVGGYLIDDSMEHITSRSPSHGFCLARPWNTGLPPAYFRGSYSHCLRHLGIQV